MQYKVFSTSVAISLFREKMTLITTEIYKPAGLQRLRNRNLTLNEEKCQLLQNSHRVIPAVMCAQHIYYEQQVGQHQKPINHGFLPTCMLRGMLHVYGWLHKQHIISALSAAIALFYKSVPFTLVRECWNNIGLLNNFRMIMHAKVKAWAFCASLL